MGAGGPFPRERTSCPHWPNQSLYPRDEHPPLDLLNNPVGKGLDSPAP